MFHCVRHLDHACFITLPPEAAHSSKATEVRYMQLKLESYF